MAFKGEGEKPVVIHLDKKRYAALSKRAHENDRTTGREATVIVKKELDEK